MSYRPKDPHKNTRNNVDQLLERAESLRSKLNSGKTNSTEENSAIIESINEIRSDLGYLARTIFYIKEALSAFYQRFISPIINIFKPLFAWVWGKYASVWNRFAFTKSKTGEKLFSKSRASILILLTILFVSGFTPTSLGNAVRFVTVEPFWDGTLMLFSKKTETFYLYTSEEVDPEGNVHAVRGCRVQGECSEKDSVYFRVKPRLAHDIWKLIVYSNPIYVPDHVVAPIAPGVNKCLVTYYGYRMTSSWISRLLKSFQFYPTMLEASCEHESVVANTNN